MNKIVDTVFRLSQCKNLFNKLDDYLTKNSLNKIVMRKGRNFYLDKIYEMHYNIIKDIVKLKFRYQEGVLLELDQLMFI